MNEFIDKLVEITGVSRAYASAAWYCLNGKGKEKPIQSAIAHATRYGLYFASRGKV